MHRRGGKGCLGRARGLEAGFESVAEGYQGVYFGDDAMLFGDGGNRKSNIAYRANTECYIEIPLACGGYAWQPISLSE